jgi:hypothetical protein
MISATPAASNLGETLCVGRSHQPKARLAQGTSNHVSAATLSRLPMKVATDRLSDCSRGQQHDHRLLPVGWHLVGSVTEGEPTREGRGDLLVTLIDEGLDLLQGVTASIGPQPGVQMLRRIES